MSHLLQVITVELQRVSCTVGNSTRHGMQHEKAAGQSRNRQVRSSRQLNRGPLRKDRSKAQASAAIEEAIEMIEQLRDGPFREKPKPETRGGIGISELAFQKWPARGFHQEGSEHHPQGSCGI